MTHETIPTNDDKAKHGPEAAPAASGKTNGESFDTWAIVELMGHRKLAGRVSEQIIAGVPLLRIDVPQCVAAPGFTTYYGASSIYSLTPTTEAICRAYTAAHRERPVQAYELPALNAAQHDIQAEQDGFDPEKN
ncbi:MAG: acetyltransferase [Acidobacteriia bacterium]|nr:acetyltransferase [Terriglobia bacterium]